VGAKSEFYVLQEPFYRYQLVLDLTWWPVDGRWGILI